VSEPQPVAGLKLVHGLVNLDTRVTKAKTAGGSALKENT
jgi:hypothetical protein